MLKKQEPFRNSDPQRKQNPKFRARVLLLVVTLISFASIVYAQNPDYDEQNYSFRSGYTAGYGHGYADQQGRTNFDFRRGREYQTRTDDRAYRSGDYHNNVSQQDLNVRLGYVEGYADGYFRRNPLFRFQQQAGSNGYYNQDNQDYRSTNQGQGAITVFTGTGYQGYARQFGIGQYPSIEGRLDDDIQSVRVNGSLRVVLFEHDKFKGKSIVLERDTWDLGNFRKKAGSMIIEPIRYGQIR
jgi:hypothetical protein